MLSSLVFAAALAAAAPAPKPFEFKGGDRIVWLGNTLVEREQRYGYWEAALLAAHPDKAITVRNLGWSGDTVHGEARGRFDFNNPDKCFNQIVEQTLALKPTVIFVSYGTNESFEGKEGLPKFEKGLEKLLDALKPANARVVLFTPMPFESGPGYKARNATLELYGTAIKRIANKRELALADLYVEIDETFHAHETADPVRPPPLTDNGMHLTEVGYRDLADNFVLAITAKKHQFDWEKLEPLRKVVVAKNEQFFNKWRPQNETYLFGFRKHEQGNNAKEIAEFDPFVAKAEGEIARLLKGPK